MAGVMTPPNFDSIPTEIQNIPQWILWRYEDHGKPKLDKVPYQPWDDRKAATDDPRTWSSFSTVVEAYKKGRFDGIGFVLRPPYVGLDLDHCILEDGTIEPQAEEIIKRLASYSEKSPSEKGIHVIAKGKIPRGRKKGDFEMYQLGRYFTVTGDHFPGTPTTIKDRPDEITAVYQELFEMLSLSACVDTNPTTPAPATTPALTDEQIIALAAGARNGDKFLALMAGDTSGYPSQSEADEALCFILAFYSRDQEQICRIIQQSKLWDEKWEREDYQERTIGNALEKVTETYSRDPGKVEGEGEEEAPEGLSSEDLTKWTKKLEPIIDEQTGYPDLDEDGRPKTKPGRTLSPSKAAVAMLEHLPLAAAAASIRDKEPPIWIYDGGLWHDRGQREIISLVDHLLQDLSYDRGLRETLRRIRGRLAQEPVVFDSDPFIMPLKDGVVDLRTGAFRVAHQDDYLTFKYNASWTGPADYRPFLWHLCSCLPDSRDVLTAIDIFAAVALRVPFEVFWLFFGGGANGKGVLEALLQVFFTLRRSTQIRLTELKNSRFGEGALLSKDVWIVSEVESVKDVLSSIKKISSGETIDVDVKYGERRQGAPHLLPIFDSNVAFDFGESTKGLKRRLEKLDFPFTFGYGPEDRPKDPLMKEKLTRPEVLNGIARIIAARAPALIESRQIYHRKSEEEIQEEYKRQRFSLNYYCEDCLNTTWPYEMDSKEDLRLTTEKAYSEYLEYCRKFNVTDPAGKVPFGKYINERFGIQSIHTKEKSKDFRYYPGLYLIKSASLAYADVRTTYSTSSSDSSDRKGTEERQKKYSGIDISGWIATGATEESCSDIMRDILGEIKNMFDYIKSCESKGSLQDIVYEKYLKNPVAPVATVARGQRIAKIPATEGVTEENLPVAEEEKDPHEKIRRAIAEGITDPLKLSEFCGLPVEIVSRDAARYPGINLQKVGEVLVSKGLACWWPPKIKEQREIAEQERQAREEHFRELAEQINQPRLASKEPLTGADREQEVPA